MKNSPDDELGYEPIGQLGLSTTEWATAFEQVRHMLE